MALDEATFGNSVIIELIKTYLELAEQKPIGAVGIVMAARVGPNQPVAAIDWAGVDGSLEEPMLEALDHLRSRIAYSVDCWMLPVRNESLDDSYIVWNMAHCPLGFDFIPWLIDAEMNRVRQGITEPLKVGFYLGKDAIDRMKKLNRAPWLNNVYRPAVQMLGAIEDPVKAIFGRPPEVMSLRTTVEACRRGEKVPMFRSGLPPRRPGCVTITLRETVHWKHRNSDLNEWLLFANYLRRCGEEVVFVRDTAKARETIDDFPIDPDASIDLRVRMNLYESAKCNLSEGGGPWQMCLFSDRPWLAFIRVEEPGAPYEPNIPENFEKGQGIKMGEQFPWQQPDQRIVWQPATYDNIVAAWETLHTK